MTPGDTRPRGSVIDLTRESDFRLGDAAVRPSRGEVAPPGAPIRLQPRVMQVLVALARADGEVLSREALVEQCWGGVVVGDDALNRCIVRLRRLAEETGGAFAIETLPRLGYRLTGNEAGVKPGDGGMAAGRWRRWRRPAPFLAASSVAAVLALVGGFVILRLARPTTPVVALAPFASSPDDPPTRTLAAGVEADVAAAITAGDFATVVHRSADDSGGDHAAFILDARIEGGAPQVRGEAELVQRSDKRILWTGNFERPAAAATTLRAQMAAKVADVLRCAFDATRAGHFDTDTLTLFLKACDGIHDFGKEDEVRDALQRVVDRQPRFARALAMMAIADSIAADTLPPGQGAAAKHDAKAAADRALQLDPNEPSAYVALANLNDETTAGHMAAIATLRRGVARAPGSPELNNWLGGLLLQMGYVDDGLRYGQRSVALDPFTPLKPILVADSLSAAGRVQDARALLDQTVLRWPDTADLIMARVTLEMEAGEAGRAATLLADPANRPHFWDAPTAARLRAALAIRAAGGDTRAAAARELALEHSGVTSPNFATRALLALGDVDGAFTATAVSDVAHSIDTNMLFEPAAAPMRRDRRFPELVRRLGLVAFWRGEHRWPDFCRDPGLPYDCRRL